MKKSIFKLCVLAAMVALPSMAFAGAITLGTADVDINTYAAELNYDSTATPAGTALVAGDTVETTLGFGVSAGQNRYARFILANAKFNGAVGGLTDLTTVGAGTTGFGANALASAGVTVVSGGTAGDTCVVYQVTGLDVTGNGASDTVSWVYPTLDVTTSADVTATYTLHETATSASCGNIGTSSDSTTLLAAPVAGTILNFADSLVFTGANGTTATADVTSLYTVELDTVGVVDTTVLQLGTLTTDILDVNTESDNSPVDQADLLTAASILISGDFGAATSVTLSSTDCDAPTVVDTAVIAADKQSATFSGAAILALYPDAVSAAITNNICYNTGAANAVPIVEQTYTATVTFTPAVGATLAAQTVQPAGNVDRDGTVLKAPMMTGTAGQFTFVQLANMGVNDAPYTVRCFAPSGATSTGVAGTVTAGNTSKLFMNNLGCGAGANAVEFTLAVPSGNVVGTLVRQSTTSGDSALDSLTGNQ